MIICYRGYPWNGYRSTLGQNEQGMMENIRVDVPPQIPMISSEARLSLDPRILAYLEYHERLARQQGIGHSLPVTQCQTGETICQGPVSDTHPMNQNDTKLSMETSGDLEGDGSRMINAIDRLLAEQTAKSTSKINQLIHPEPLSSSTPNRPMGKAKADPFAGALPGIIATPSVKSTNVHNVPNDRSYPSLPSVKAPLKTATPYVQQFFPGTNQ